MKMSRLAIYVLSIVGMGFFMSHFWWPTFWGGAVAWPIAGACAISCIYGGIIGRSQEGNPVHKAILLAAAVIGGIILLGITLSAIFIFVPAMG